MCEAVLPLCSKWHTGKNLACHAVGPWFNSRLGQGPLFNSRLGQGILQGIILNQDGTLQWQGGLILELEHFPFTNAASQWSWWLYVNLVCRFHIPALVGFLRAPRFPPTPKNRNPSYLLVVRQSTLIHSRSQSAVHSIPRMGNPIKIMGDGQPMATNFPHCVTLVTKRATYMASYMNLNCSYKTNILRQLPANLEHLYLYLTPIEPKN